ncbi:hypothetical protein ACOTJN_25895 [Achromobacter xylosoxidans]
MGSTIEYPNFIVSPRGLPPLDSPQVLAPHEDVGIDVVHALEILALAIDGNAAPGIPGGDGTGQGAAEQFLGIDVEQAELGDPAWQAHRGGRTHSGVVIEPVSICAHGDERAVEPGLRRQVGALYVGAADRTTKCHALRGHHAARQRQGQHAWNDESPHGLSPLFVFSVFEIRPAWPGPASVLHGP